MKASKVKQIRRWRRKRRVRKNVAGTESRPRLTVFRAHKSISAQIIDDDCGQTICQVSTRNKDLRADFPYGGNIDAAKRLGGLLAERAKAKGISDIVLDRNGYRYHGRVKALADGAREGGLKF